MSIEWAVYAFTVAGLGVAAYMAVTSRDPGDGESPDWGAAGVGPKGPSWGMFVDTGRRAGEVGV